MGMVDIHSHILPGVDDGSTSWEATIAMCELAAKDGITHMVATPHSDDTYKYDRKKHEETLQELRERIGGAMEFSVGCDFHMSFENITAVRRTPAEFCIGNTNYLLVEFSDFGVSRKMLKTLEEFLDFGLTPIVTHPERNRMLQANPDLIIEMAEAGCLVQVTANSLTGFWGSTARKIGEWLLKQNAVHVLASDAHDPKHRLPVLSKGRAAAAAIVGEEIASLLVCENPQAIVRGETLS
jgi:protein-tyrosine phosphatase